jgi:glycosyltransferase involved in cell wall biosynthesis
MTRPSILPYVQHQGFGKVDLLYIDSLVQSFWLGRIEAKKTLFRMTDDLPSLDKATPSFAKVERELIQQADAVTYTSRVLEKKIFPLKPKRTFYVPAGVHLKDFAVSESRILPDEYKKIPKPIAVYVGSIGSRFDDQLLSLTARRLPKVSFVLIGPEKEARQKLPNLSNLYLLGTKPYDSIPPYLWNAALGLIPLNVRCNPGLVHSTHPLKLYQYLACGLPVVSTDWETIRDLHSPALLSRNFEGFVKNIKTALDQPKPVRNNIRFARKHEWKNRLKEIFYWLEEASSTVRQVRAGKGSK